MEALEGSLTMAADSTAASQDGTLRMAASTGVTVSKLDAGVGVISLVAHGGAISRSTTADSVVNLRASALRLQARDAIGSAAAPLVTDVQAVAATSAGGDIRLLNQGALTIGRVDDVVLFREVAGASTLTVADRALSGLSTAGAGGITVRTLAGTLGTVSIFYDVSRRLTLRARAGEESAIDLIFTIRYD